MANAITINTIVDSGGSITSTFQQQTTIQSTITAGGQGPPGTFADYFDVKAYGALGNGVNNDTAAIQEAIDTAHANGGGIVFFPNGTYLIDFALVVYPHITLSGSGDGAVDGSGGGMGTAASTILQTVSDQGAITGVDVYEFNINQLAFTGPGIGTATGINLTLDFHDDSRYIHFTDITVQEFGVDGIAVDTLIISQFDRVVSYGNGRYGYNLYASGVSAATSLTATSCWAHNNAGNGWNIDHMVYSSFISCGADVNSGVGYNVNNCQSIALYSCGSESNVSNAFKVQGASYNVSAVSCWSFHNSTIGFYVTGASQNVAIIGFHENTPTGSPTASIQVDTGCIATVIGYFINTATSFATGTTTILNDSAGNITAQQITALAGLFTKGTSGVIAINGNTDGGDYNFAVDTSGVLAFYGSSAAVLNVNLLDGYLQLTPLTATTVPYLDSNKRFVSSSVTPTELGYVHGVTSSIQTQINALAGGGMTNPMTTLGDVIYENATPAAARLAGNTTTTKKYLSQTGNGTISAVPAWGQIAVADLSGLGTSVATALAVAIGSAGAMVLFNGAGGTPTSLTLTNATGLPIAGITGLGTGIAAALAIATGSTGAPVLLNGAGGTPSSLTLTSATGLPIAGLTGLGTGVATLLGQASNGTGGIAGISSPSFTTPTLGAATATSLNKVTITAPGTSATLTLITGSSLITAGAFALTLTSTATTNATFPTGTITVAGTAATQTLTNKWIQKRVNTVASSATPAINTDTTDLFTITALALAITSMTTSLTGTPVAGQELWIRIKDNATARAITWGAKFTSSGVATLLATTVISKTHLSKFIWDEAASLWVCVAVDATGY